MASYYAVTLTTDIPHGSDVLNKECKLKVQQLTPSGLATLMVANGVVLAWQASNIIVFKTSYMNIPNTGGTVKIAGVRMAYTGIVPV